MGKGGSWKRKYNHVAADHAELAPIIKGLVDEAPTKAATGTAFYMREVPGSSTVEVMLKHYDPRTRTLNAGVRRAVRNFETCDAIRNMLACSCCGQDLKMREFVEAALKHESPRHSTIKLGIVKAARWVTGNICPDVPQQIMCPSRNHRITDHLCYSFTQQSPPQCAQGRGKTAQSRGRRPDQGALVQLCPRV